LLILNKAATGTANRVWMPIVGVMATKKPTATPQATCSGLP
jgi:hypothetical protein